MWFAWTAAKSSHTTGRRCAWARQSGRSCRSRKRNPAIANSTALASYAVRSPRITARLAPVAEGKFAGLRSHVAEVVGRHRHNSGSGAAGGRGFADLSPCVSGRHWMERRFGGIGVAGWRPLPADSRIGRRAYPPHLPNYHALRYPTIPALSEALADQGRPGRITLAWGVMKLAPKSPVGVICQ